MDTVWLDEDEWQAVEAAMRPVEEAFASRTMLQLSEPQATLANDGPEFVFASTPTEQAGSTNDTLPVTDSYQITRRACSTSTTILPSNHPSSATLPLAEEAAVMNDVTHCDSKKQRLLPTWAVNGCKGEKALPMASFSGSILYEYTPTGVAAAVDLLTSQLARMRRERVGKGDMDREGMNDLQPCTTGSVSSSSNCSGCGCIGAASSECEIIDAVSWDRDTQRHPIKDCHALPLPDDDDDDDEEKEESGGMCEADSAMTGTHMSSNDGLASNKLHAAVGFDLEWRPTFQAGVAPRPAATVQLCCSPSACHVYHITAGGLPQNLRALLCDPTVLKVGVGVKGDAWKLHSDYGVPVSPVVDLAELADERVPSIAVAGRSLSSLCANLLGMELSKSKAVRLGNWERVPLTSRQLQYAAADAYISWRLYEALMKIPVQSTARDYLPIPSVEHDTDTSRHNKILIPT